MDEYADNPIDIFCDCYIVIYGDDEKSSIAFDQSIGRCFAAVNGEGIEKNCTIKLLYNGRQYY